jgi:hypothetical protein
MPPATGGIMASLPPHKAGVGSAVNDLDRELGGAFGIGVLSSITLSYYRSRLDPALAALPSRTVASAKSGLGQALAVGGTGGTGTGGPFAAAARHAYSAGLDLAMAAGAGCVAAAAAAVYLTLRTRAASQGPAQETAAAASTPSGPASQVRF